MRSYCGSRFVTIRRKTREVKVGNVGVGATNPIRIQSMTTTVTTDIEATVKQSRALVEAGCEIVRITAPNLKSAQALKEISRRLRNDKIDVPLVADIHFLPSAAMEAVEHVEKVRVNPGNYADKKKFLVREYSEKEYELELERLHDAFSPLVLRCKELGRSMRIGTNHGSLSDRIMNRCGDSPAGMVESALEFIRIAESHDYRDIILSMKASNPKVMIQAYRLVVAKMNAEGMNYPLHLGVTEAGDGEDGRIKSAIGIGSLLIDGLGDTIRVSLTEDPVYEIPVAKALVEKTSLLWKHTEHGNMESLEDINPFEFCRRKIRPLKVSELVHLNTNSPPRVFIRPANIDTISLSLREFSELKKSNSFEDTPIEGWIIGIENSAQLNEFLESSSPSFQHAENFILDIGKGYSNGPESLNRLIENGVHVIPSLRWDFTSKDAFLKWSAYCRTNGILLALGINSEQLAKNAQLFLQNDLPDMILWATNSSAQNHMVGEYRLLVAVMKSLEWNAPLWIRCQEESFINPTDDFQSHLLEVSLLAGALLSDGIGDIISIETLANPRKALALAYNTLQGAGSRISKTDYVACPSCGRTLFDLQKTTQTIREATNHLKGVKIAVMGCIVNGPGEMADADFGYVGGSPGKINLYLGKDCVQYHVPESEAVLQLIQLIKKADKWVEPKTVSISDS